MRCTRRLPRGGGGITLGLYRSRARRICPGRPRQRGTKYPNGSRLRPSQANPPRRAAPRRSTRRQCGATKHVLVCSRTSTRYRSSRVCTVLGTTRTTDASPTYQAPSTTPPRTVHSWRSPASSRPRQRSRNCQSRRHAHPQRYQEDRFVDLDGFRSLCRSGSFPQGERQRPRHCCNP